jgi:hypothetical protein
MAGLLVGIAVALLIAYLAAERPISFSLVDRECENAQQQYYDARDRVRQNKNQNPSHKIIALPMSVTTPTCALRSVWQTRLKLDSGCCCSAFLLQVGQRWLLGGR